MKYPLYKVRGGPHSPAPMTFAAIPWLSITINLLLVVFVIVCLLMILLVLMQRPKQEGLGAAFGGGVTDQMFGARTTNVLQRGTVYLASAFFILSLTLAVLIGHKNKQRAIIDEPAPAAEEKQEAAPASAEDAQPKSLSEELPAEAPAEAGNGETTSPAEAEQPAAEPAADAAPEASAGDDQTQSGEAPAPAEEQAADPAPAQADPPSQDAGDVATDGAEAPEESGAAEEKTGEQ